MTTRFEQIAAAFPLHAQRIAEATRPQESFDWLFRPNVNPPMTAKSILMSAFPWMLTEEGHDYWSALAFGDGYPDRGLL